MKKVWLVEYADCCTAEYTLRESDVDRGWIKEYELTPDDYADYVNAEKAWLRWQDRLEEAWEAKGAS
jgi:hypothetical protein